MNRDTVEGCELGQGLLPGVLKCFKGEGSVGEQSCEHGILKFSGLQRLTFLVHELHIFKKKKK